MAESFSEASDVRADAPARPLRTQERRAEPPKDRAREPPTQPVVPAVYFAVLFAGAWVALAHEVLVRQPAAYLDPGFGPARELVTTAGVTSALAGVVIARRQRDPRQSLGWLLALLSLGSILAAPLLVFAFAHSASFFAAVLGLPAAIGFLLGLTLEAARRVLGRTLLALGAVEYLLNPFRLLGLTLAFGGAAASAALIGLLRSGAIIGLVFAALALWAAPLLVYLERLPLPGASRPRAAAGACFGLGLAALAAAELVVPLREQAYFEGDIVYASTGPGPRHFVLSVQDSFELFTDHSLKLSTLDQHRYYESLVLPALAAAPAAKRALVLGSGDGMIERELLQNPGIEQITVVVAERALADLARSMPWLVRLNERALSSARVRVHEAEPFVYLEPHAPPFDVILVDLPDPEDYAAGKYYSRHFFRLLARRLAQDGVLSVQITSPFTTPKSAGSIVASLRAAGFELLEYRAPLPTLGEWGFALAAVGRTPRPALFASGRFLTAELWGGMRQAARDSRHVPEAAPSYLYDQAVVALFEEETAALFR